MTFVLESIILLADFFWLFFLFGFALNPRVCSLHREHTCIGFYILPEYWSYSARSLFSYAWATTFPALYDLCYHYPALSHLQALFSKLHRISPCTWIAQPLARKLHEFLWSTFFSSTPSRHCSSFRSPFCLRSIWVPPLCWLKIPYGRMSELLRGSHHMFSFSQWLRFFVVYWAMPESHYLIYFV